MTGAEPSQLTGFGPHLILAAVAVAWFALVVPIAAWLETRRQRRGIEEIHLAAADSDAAKPAVAESEDGP